MWKTISVWKKYCELLYFSSGALSASSIVESTGDKNKGER